MKTSTKSKPSPAARSLHDRRAQLRRFTSHRGRLSSATVLTLMAWVRHVSPRILGTSSFATEMAGMPRYVRDERLEAREILRPVTILPTSRAPALSLAHNWHCAPALSARPRSGCRFLRKISRTGAPPNGERAPLARTCRKGMIGEIAAALHVVDSCPNALSPSILNGSRSMKPIGWTVSRWLGTKMPGASCSPDERASRRSLQPSPVQAARRARYPDAPRPASDFDQAANAVEN